MSTLTFDSISATPRRKAGRVARRALAGPVALAVPAADAVQRRPRAATIALVAAIAVLHGAAVVALSGARDRIAPAPIPVPIVMSLVTPPAPIAPPPKAAAPAPRQRTPAPVRVAAARPAAAPVVASQTAPVAATPEMVQAAHIAAAAAPEPAPAPEPVTEPRGYAGYLRNPAPDYPPLAQKRGLEGKVVLKVHVLASGQPDSVAVATSSGHQILDEAALRAVMQWAFAPARRGQVAIDGWVQIPLTFKI